MHAARRTELTAENCERHHRYATLQNSTHVLSAGSARILEKPMIKILSVIAFLVAAGCSGVPTMEELETQAMLTGDWSAVDKRERSVARRLAQAPMQCPDGYAAICEVRFAERKCACATRDSFRMAFSR